MTRAIAAANVVRIGLPPRPSGLNDDGDLIVVAVTEPVEGHVEVNSTNINIENPLSITSSGIKHLNYKSILSLKVLP